MKVALPGIALLVIASLILCELPFGDAAMFIIVALAMMVTLGGLTILWVYVHPRPLRGIVATLLLLLGGFHIAGGPLYYRAPDIEGQVVDGETNDPIADARVVATWELRSVLGGTLEARRTESRTNRGGSFVVPGWGWRLRPPLYYLESAEPQLEVSAPGYRTLAEPNLAQDRVPALVGEQWGEALLILSR